MANDDAAPNTAIKHLLFITTFHDEDGTKADKLEVLGKDLEEAKENSRNLAACLKLVCGETRGPLDPVD